MEKRMRPNGYMWLGLFVSVASIAIEMAGADIGWILFAGGALFGKGYGVWEERSKEGNNR